MFLAVLGVCIDPLDGCSHFGIDYAHALSLSDTPLVQKGEIPQVSVSLLNALQSDGHARLSFS